jgi:uncharacterized membrane protein
MDKLLKIYFLNKKQDSLLVIISIVSVALMLLRVKLTHEIYLLFLIWNLFLAFLPYYFSSKLKETIPGSIRFYIISFVWLLFLPNSFYLITDFVHLHYNSMAQFVYDAILLSFFTIAGFYAGYISMTHILFILNLKYSSKKSWLIIIFISYLSAFGVYLGRILRFNSWDIITKPFHLTTTIFDTFFEVESLFFTASLGSFIIILYSIFIKRNKI